VSGMKSRVQRAREQLKAMLLRCCEVEVDRRRGVAAFHPRASGSCGASEAAAPSSCGCGVGTRSPCRQGAGLRPERITSVFQGGTGEA
jgi:hypothetical protein